MNSLIRREGMAGKVQCIYIDPPYGVNYNSNFQPVVDNPVVKDGQDESLTREPEQIKAYRDTWKLGTHSYLTYLRDRLLLAKELLADSGSLFVQISDENVHLVRQLMDEVFGRNAFVSQIAFKTKMPLGTKRLASIYDYLIWYAREDADRIKYRPLFADKQAGLGSLFEKIELPDGSRRRLDEADLDDEGNVREGRLYRLIDLSSAGLTPGCVFDVELGGRVFQPTRGKSWKTNRDGMDRLIAARRVEPQGNGLGYVYFHDDSPAQAMTTVWTDTRAATKRTYAVETFTGVIARCLLMSTDPGDLVLDPTCGSGTTAYVAEQWGRRWITCDTSRVALALARQRLMTASYDYYQLADADRGVDGGLDYETIPYVTLGSIAQDEPAQTRPRYDRPRVDRRKTRVAGPFTVEQIPSFGIEQADGDGIGEYDPGALDDHDRADDVRRRSEEHPVRSIGELVDLLRIDGVRLPGGRHLEFTSLAQTATGGQVHAEGEYLEAGEPRRIAVSFGPLHGPLSARQVEDVLTEVTFTGYHAILFAGFAFDAAAQEFLSKYRTPAHLQVLTANIAADVLVPDLLKNRRGQQLFAVFGEPDARLHRSGSDFTVELLGMDVYDPATGEVSSSGTDGVAAWFLDADYDRRSFLVSQAFFPGSAGGTDPWARLGRALRGWVDPDAFEALRGTVSLPFPRGEQGRAAIKVIDFRGNEAIRILDLPDA
jgi:adenine-specific DNA-methyltransferase